MLASHRDGQRAINPPVWKPTLPTLTIALRTAPVWSVLQGCLICVGIHVTWFNTRAGLLHHQQHSKTALHMEGMIPRSIIGGVFHHKYLTDWTNSHLLQDVLSSWQRNMPETMLQIVCRGKADSQQSLPMSTYPIRSDSAQKCWVPMAPIDFICTCEHSALLHIRPEEPGRWDKHKSHKKVSWLKRLTQQHAQRLQQQQGQKRILLIHLPLSQDDPFSSNRPFPLFFSPRALRFYG